MQQILYPTKIIKRANVEGVKALRRKQNLQIDLNERDIAKFHKGGYVILDFGKEMRGGIRILTYASDLSNVRIRFGESVGECCAELGAGEAYSGNENVGNKSEKAIRQNATNDHATRDFFVTLPNWSDMPFGDTGFRFVRLDFFGEVALKSVVCVNHILSKRAKYVYKGNDVLTKKIFKVAKRTIDLCASSGYIWDGIKRDRLVWAGDLYPEVLALTALYGRTAEVEHSLDFVREYTPLPRWMDGIATYSLWWIIILYDYLENTGAEDFIAKQMDYLESLVKQIADGTNEKGEMNYPSYFVDWPRAGFMEEREGFRAINIMATRSAIGLLKKFNRDTTVAEKHLSCILKQEIHAESKVVAALKYWAIGKLTNEEQALLLSDGAKGFSTFMSYYILKAVHSFNPQLATAMMQEYYGGMLKVGSTTFWEDFDVEWINGACPLTRLPKKGEKDLHGDFGKHCYVGFRKSLCHGWAAGIIAYMKECEE